MFVTLPARSPASLKPFNSSVVVVPAAMKSRVTEPAVAIAPGASDTKANLRSGTAHVLRKFAAAWISPWSFLMSLT